jgi:hypothetical protein
MARRMLINPEEWDAVASDLGTAIHYWARALTTQEWTALNDLGLGDEWHAVRVHEESHHGELIVWRRQEFETALAQVEFVVPGTRASMYALSSFSDRDMKTGFIETTHIDAELGDVALQLHAWGEVVFG